MRFEQLQYLHLLWLVPVLAAVCVYGFRRRRAGMRVFVTENLIARIAPDTADGRRKLKAVLVLAGLASLVMAAVDPRWSKTIVEVQRRGVDIIVCLDVSRSMLAEDIAPNRLERAKSELADMLKSLRGDRIGLVTFAGKPVLSCPLTIDYGAFRMTLDDVDTQSSPRGGTLIGDAVRLAADSFTDKVKDHKAILVITDGEDQSSLPIEAAADAYQQRGIRVFTVGLGDMVRGTRIPIKTNGQRQYLQYNGQEVWSKMDRETLRKMALAAGGIYFPVGTRDADFVDVYERIRSKVEATQLASRRQELWKPGFQWFAGLGLFLLVFETLISDRRPAARGRGMVRVAA